MLEVSISSGRSVADWTAYSPLIVGLGAVVLGLIANSLLEWLKRRMDRAGEARGLRAALLSELKVNRDSLDGRMENSNDLRKGGGGRLFIPINNNTRVYDTNLPKLGILEPSEIYAVIKCYEFLVGAPKNFGFLGNICGDDYNRWLEIDARWKNVAIQMDKDAVAHLDEAILALSKN